MVAIRSEDGDSFFTRDISQFAVVLVFGSDAGIVQERIGRALRSFGASSDDPFQIVRLDGSEIARDPSRLFDEIATVSLFASNRVVLVSLGSSDITAIVEAALATSTTGWKIVISAGALKKDAAVRKVCERSRLATAIECLPDNPAFIEKMLDRELLSNEISCDFETRSFIIKSMGADRLSTRVEIAKLATYAADRGNLTLKDAESLLADTSGLAAERVVKCSFVGNMQELETTWRRLLATGGDGGGLIATALREATALHQLFAETEAGGSRERAEQRYFRSAYGRTPLSSTQLKPWNATKALRATEMISTAMRRVRREPLIASEHSLRALWSIAFIARQ